MLAALVSYEQYKKSLHFLFFDKGYFANSLNFVSKIRYMFHSIEEHKKVNKFIPYKKENVTNRLV